MKYNYNSRNPHKGSSMGKINKVMYGLSWPTLGGCWQEKASGRYYEVVGSYPTIVLRERIENPGELVKLTDLEAFYQNYSYMGKVKVHDE